MSPPIPKMIADAVMQFILSVVLEKTVRFIATVNVALKDNNSCLPNNKKLSVKLVLIVFG